MMSNQSAVMPPPLRLRLLAAVALIVAPHAANLPWPVLLGFYAVAGWQVGIVTGRWRGPRRRVLATLAVVVAAMIFSEAHGEFNLDTATALFVAALGLKLLETNSQRDVYVTAFLGLFVATTQFLYNQSIFMAAYALAVTAFTMSVLLTLNGAGHGRARPSWRWAGILVGQAVPLMVAMFVLFPRVAGPLWKLPGAGQVLSRTGISDELELGRMSQLAHDQAVAFRVNFTDALPPARERYWRGPVFSWTDGVRWLPDTAEPPARAPRIAADPASYRYTVVLEPHGQRWLFALDYPAALMDVGGAVKDGMWLADAPVEERIAYQAVSTTSDPGAVLTQRERATALQLPLRRAERVDALAATWAQLGDAAAVVQQALEYFHAQPFVYTTEPTNYAGNPIERFMFEGRRGFCEHYATAFVYLMRSAGVPARVVTGYQGGTYNSIGQFIEVRQADAHAWAEVWLDGRGWWRVDPTAVVDPARIERGIDEVLEAVADPAARATANDRTARWWRRWWLQARVVWASAEHQWHRWVLSYTPDRQANLYQWFRGVRWQTWLETGGALWLAAAVGLALHRRWLRARVVQRDPVMAQYRRYCGKLARYGVVPRVGETPTAFAERAAAAVPAQREEIRRINALYLRLRYGRGADPGQLQELKMRIRGLPSTAPVAQREADGTVQRLPAAN